MSDQSSWVGVMPEWEIIEQLVSVALDGGYAAADLEEAGAPTWNVLAANALGLQRDGRRIERAVIRRLREKAQR